MGRGPSAAGAPTDQADPLAKLAAALPAELVELWASLDPEGRQRLLASLRKLRGG